MPKLCMSRRICRNITQNRAEFSVEPGSPMKRHVLRAYEDAKRGALYAFSCIKKEPLTCSVSMAHICSFLLKAFRSFVCNQVFCNLPCGLAYRSFALLFGDGSLAVYEVSCPLGRKEYERISAVCFFIEFINGWIK